MKYFLSNDAYVCRAGGHAVFLDLKKNKYTALAPHHAQALVSIVDGWPADEQSASAGNSTALEVAKELATEGLLTRDGGVGKPATAVNIERATQCLGTAPGLFPELTWREARNFVWAWIRTTIALRYFPLRVVVAKVRRRKARRTAREFDLQYARRLTMAYFILQPNFFSAIDNCLRNSLTLTEFLASYDLYPTWVFGVRMSPFAAHSWVQESGVVLNDTVSHVRSFTPIMKV